MPPQAFSAAYILKLLVSNTNTASSDNIEVVTFISLQCLVKPTLHPLKYIVLLTSSLKSPSTCRNKYPVRSERKLGELLAINRIKILLNIQAIGNGNLFSTSVEVTMPTKAQVPFSVSWRIYPQTRRTTVSINSRL
jgi:hypothetical protein